VSAAGHRIARASRAGHYKLIWVVPANRDARRYRDAVVETVVDEATARRFAARHAVPMP
jgi:hypothetical protein